jgi:hypothetical protein
MTRLALAAALMIGALAAPATANEIFASEPKSVVTALQNLGYRAAISTDSAGNPLIESGIAGINYNVFFYGCDGTTNCQWIEFSTSFTLNTPSTLASMNDWNTNNLFGTGFIGSDGATFLTYVVTTTGGLTRENFDDIVRRWDVSVTDFMRHINF